MEKKENFNSIGINKKSVAGAHPVRGISGPGNWNEKDKFSSYITFGLLTLLVVYVLPVKRDIYLSIYLLI